MTRQLGSALGQSKVVQAGLREAAASGGRGDEPPARRSFRSGAAPAGRQISGALQLGLALYILFTSSLPTIVQSIAYGVEGGATSEFIAALATGLTLDLLLVLPVLVLARHPLGILHPLVLIIVVWPLIREFPYVIGQFGGWAGVVTGERVQVPHFLGLRSQVSATVWLGVTKYNALQILALLSTYAGFWLFKVGDKPRIAVALPDPGPFRMALMALVAASTLVLLAFVYSRGGLVEHVTSLGQGRFNELAGSSDIIVIARLGVVAVLLWIAARPDDVKSPLFLACLAIVSAGQFIGSGSRSLTIEVILMTGLVWALRKQTIPWRMALVVAPAAFLLLGLLSATRTSSWTGSNAAEAFSSTGLSEAFNRAQEELTERQMVSAQVPIVERGFQVTGGPLLGQTYAAALTQFVPRRIWPDKPRGAGSLFAQLFLGASETEFGSPVQKTTEMYWNFGAVGVVFLSLLFGVLIRLAYRAFWRRYPSPFAIVFYTIVVVYFEFSTLRLVPFQQFMGLLLICYLATRLVPARRQAQTIRLRPFAPGQQSPAAASA